MTHLIDKDALIKEIENLENTYKKCPTRNSYEEGLKNGRLIGYKDALHKINTLETKEVDLKTMFREYVTKIYTEEYSREILDGSATNVDSSDLFGAMCHGFELGLKARK